MNLADTALLWLMVAFAAVIQGLAGIGGALVATPLMTLVVDAQSAIVLFVPSQAAISIWLAYKARAEVNWREIRPILLTGLLGVIVGDRLLNTLEIRLIQVLLGIAVLLFATDMLLREIKRARAVTPEWPAGVNWIGGLFVGGILGLLGTAGPPLVILLMHRPLNAFQVRACVVMVIALLSSWRLGTYLVSGTLSGPLQVQSLVLVPASVAGAMLGAWLLPRIVEKQLRVVVAGILFLAGGLALAG